MDKGTELKRKIGHIDYPNPIEVLSKLRESRTKPFNWETLIKVLDEVEQVLLNVQEQEKKFDEFFIFENSHIMSGFEYKGENVVAMSLDEYYKFMEQDEVLDIVKEKDVDMYSLRRCETVEEYNIHFVIDEYQKLTQDEFVILKRLNNDMRESMKTINLESFGINKEIYNIPYSDLKGYKYTDKYSNNVITIEKDSNYGTNYFVMLVNGGLAKNLFGNVLYWETLNDAEKDICNLFCGNNPEHCSAFK